MQTAILYTVFIFIFAFSFGCEVVDDDDSSVEENNATITGTVMLISAYTPDYIRPLNGATVSTDPATGSARTDADGRFGIDAPNGEYLLTAEAEGCSTFLTWVGVSDDFHPELTIPLRQFDEGFVVHTVMLTDADIGIVDENYATTTFPEGTKEVFLLVESDPLDNGHVVDLVWLRDGQETMHMEDIGLSLASEYGDVGEFSISSASSDGLPEGYYYVQIQYREFASQRLEDPQVILSIPFCVGTAEYTQTDDYDEAEDLSKEKFDITVVNERNETVSVHLDGEFRFELLAEFLPEKWRKKAIEDIPGGEHTLTVFDEQGDLIASETFILDSDVTITIKPGWGL
jgi:hypothetical protein